MQSGNPLMPSDEKMKLLLARAVEWVNINYTTIEADKAYQLSWDDARELGKDLMHDYYNEVGESGTYKVIHAVESHYLGYLAARAIGEDDLEDEIADMFEDTRGGIYVKNMIPSSTSIDDIDDDFSKVQEDVFLIFNKTS
jgi:hypothetical protein